MRVATVPQKDEQLFVYGKLMSYTHLNEASTLNNEYADYLDELMASMESQAKDEYYIANGDFYVILRRFKDGFYNAYVQVKYENHEEYLTTACSWVAIADAVNLFVQGVNLMISRLNGEVK